MGTIKTFIVTLCMLSTLAYGQVQAIKKGELAPYDGYVFSLDAELKNRKELIELDALRLKTPLLEQNLNLITEQSKLWQATALEANKELYKRDQNSFWVNTGYFLIGALLTTGIVYGVNQASK